MSDAVSNSSAPAPSAPASSAPAADSVSVGTRAHSPPSRASRSARETEGENAPARRDPTARPQRRKEAEPRPAREAVEAHATDAFREALEAKGEDGEEAPEVSDDVDVTADEPAPEVEAKPEVEVPVEVQAKLDEAEKFRTEVTAKATEVLRENATLARKLEWLEAAIEAAGLEVDPDALELWTLKTEKELGQDFTKQATAQAEAARKADHERAVSAEVVKVNAEISKAAKEAKVDEVGLKARWAGMVKVWQHQGGKGDMPTLEDAVFEIKAVSDARQMKASTSAPALVKSKGAQSVAAAPRFDNNHDGWSRFLRSRGYAD